jgi:hypothetical protein
MQDPISKNSLLIDADKDTKFITQLKRVNEYLKTNAASRFMVAVDTGVPIQNVCRHVDMLFDNNLIAVIRKDRCRISGKIVEFLSTNELLFPKSNQLTLF